MEYAEFEIESVGFETESVVIEPQFVGSWI
jgi:hypothetical protein